MKRNRATRSRWTYVGLAVILAGALMTGCTLPVPKTHIAYQPATKALDIQSPKDVAIGKVEVLAEGTNFTLTITDYKASNPVEVIRAAAGAQALQLQAAQSALDQVVRAAAGAK